MLYGSGAEALVLSVIYALALIKGLLAGVGERGISMRFKGSAAAHCKKITDGKQLCVGAQPASAPGTHHYIESSN